MKDYQKIKQSILDMQDAMMTAYDKGYDDGILNGRKERMAGEYKRGLEQAWAYAGAIVSMSSAEMAKHFGVIYESDVFEKFTAEDAIERLIK